MESGILKSEGNQGSWLKYLQLNVGVRHLATHREMEAFNGFYPRSEGKSNQKVNKHFLEKRTQDLV